MDFKKLLTVNNIIKCLASILAIVGSIIFIVTATSGYLAGKSYSALPFVFALLGGLVIAGVIVVESKFPKVGPFVSMLAGASLTASFVLAIFDRANFLGDALIPMDYPADFYSAISATITCFVFIGVAIILLAVSYFIPEIKLVKEEK